MMMLIMLMFSVTKVLSQMLNMCHHLDESSLAALCFICLFGICCCFCCCFLFVCCLLLVVCLLVFHHLDDKVSSLAALCDPVETT